MNETTKKPLNLLQDLIDRRRREFDKSLEQEINELIREVADEVIDQHRRGLITYVQAANIVCEKLGVSYQEALVRLFQRAIEKLNGE